MRAALHKGVPPLFVTLRSLYSEPEKVTISFNTISFLLVLFLANRMISVPMIYLNDVGFLKGIVNKHI